MASALPPSLESYLQFLRFFRGTVTEGRGGIAVESDRREFRLRFPMEAGAGESLLEPFDGSILALPWVPWLEGRLQSGPRRRKTEIVFMSKPAGPGSPPSPSSGVRRARSVEDVETFSLVQSRGFLEDEESFREWHPWLRAANLRNQANEGCHFLIADLDGAADPATAGAVALLVESENACGIYAVATPPEHRRRGLSTALLAAAESMAAGRGHPSVCLQVYADTYAHRFYLRRGFGEEFRVGVWRAPDPGD